MTILSEEPEPLNYHTKMQRIVSPSIASTSTNSKFPPTSTLATKYYGKPPIENYPELVELCLEFLRCRNVSGLALVARQVGLPPHLRCKIWPILLKYHPFVLNPYLEINEDESEELNEISLKEIKIDLNKYLRNSQRNQKAKIINQEVKDLFEIQDKMFEVIEHAIIKFLKKWGQVVKYKPFLTWIALNLAEWFPPLQDSHFVLCGRDDMAKNGTKLRNVNESYFDKLNPSTITSQTNSSFVPSVDGSPLNSSTPTASPPSTPPSGFKQMSFAEIYERLVLVILFTPDPSTITNDLESKQSVSASAAESVPTTSVPTTSVSTSTSNTTSTSAQTLQSKSSSEELDSNAQYRKISFYGAPIDDRISFFLYAFRKLMPELHGYMSQEDILHKSWLKWWINYDGTKLWSRYDRGRTWDLILGWRKEIRCEDIDGLKNIHPQTLKLLGPDLFWDPSQLNEDPHVNSYSNLKSNLFENNFNNYSAAGIDSTDTSIIHTSDVFDLDDEDEFEDDYSNHPNVHERSTSILTLMSKNTSQSVSQSLEKTPTLSTMAMVSPPNLPQLPSSQFSPTYLNLNNETLSQLTPQLTIVESTNKLPSIEISEIPFPKVHPHVQMIFISLAFLKSKEFLIMELDPSEIKTLLEQMSSLKRAESPKGSQSISDDQSSVLPAGTVPATTSTTTTTVEATTTTPTNNTHTDSCGSLNSLNEQQVAFSANGMESITGEVKKSVRDIENVLTEAGDLWRKFLYLNMTEDA